MLSMCFLVFSDDSPGLTRIQVLAISSGIVGNNSYLYRHIRRLQIKEQTSFSKDNRL